MATILVVDDSPEACNHLAGTVLSALGHDTLVAYHGFQALDLVRQHHRYLDLMLLNLQLPDVFGLDLLRQLKQENCSVPTVLMVEHGSENIAVDAFRTGVLDYLTKPVNQDQLQAILQRVLDGARLQRQTERLTTQLKEQLTWLKMLSRVGQALTSTLEVDQVLRRIVEAGVLLTHADEGFLALLDATSGELYLRAVKNIDEFTAQTIRLPVTDSLIGQVLRSRQPLRIVQDEDRPLKVTTGYLVYSLLHIPLFAKGIPLGVISVDNRVTHKSFTPADEAILLSLADYASVALENASLYNQAQQEISERKKVEEQLRYENLHDRLTGLYNRTFLLERLRIGLEKQLREVEKLCAVLFMDVDRFKDINDSLGHLIGDQLIIAVARVLTSVLRPSDTVARLGGDEFVIFLEDIQGIEEAVKVADRIQHELATAKLMPGQRMAVSVSIGIVVSSDQHQTAEDLLRDADIAMYRAKSQGRARYEIFDPVMRDRIMQRLTLESELRHALDDGQLEIYYQPVLTAKECHLVGFEALVRWRHPERGLLLPIEFIKLAEETGLVIPLDRWVLREACAQLCVWQKQFPALLPFKVSVNLSSKQVLQPDLLEYVLGVVQETGIDPHHLNLEITESTVMENQAQTVELLTQLKSHGIQIQVDDFGVGYSSLSYLSRFPLDALKIDQSFVMNMIEDNANLRIIQAIVMLTRALGLKVIAEGVENVDQLNQLRDLGCEIVQGFFIAMPLQIEEAHAFLQQIHTGQSETGAC